MSTVKKKICKKCGEEKSLCDFRGDKRQKFGIILTCKDCRNKEKKNNGEFVRDRYRESVRRARRYGVLSDLTYSQYKEAFYSRDNCPYCGVELTVQNRSVDHIHPMCYGQGANIRECVIGCCQFCNRSKNNSHFYSFYQSSKKFTDELFTQFMLDFYTVNLEIPLKEDELPEVIDFWRQESEEWAK
jgi:5-methylcytosine-specific restriction endonuclease McrA